MLPCRREVVRRVLRWRGPSMWSVTAGRCSWCESCCSVRGVTPTWSRACRASAPTCSPLACATSRPTGSSSEPVYRHQRRPCSTSSPPTVATSAPCSTRSRSGALAASPVRRPTRQSNRAGSCSPSPLTLDPAGLDGSGSFTLDIDGQVFTLAVSGDRVVASDGSDPSCTATITGLLRDFFAAAHGESTATQRLTITAGNRAAPSSSSRRSPARWHRHL